MINLTGEEMLLSNLRQIVEQAKFAYSFNFAAELKNFHKGIKIILKKSLK